MTTDGPARARRVAEGIDFGKLPLPMSPPASVVKAALPGLGRRPLVIPGPLNRAIDFTGKYLPSPRPDAHVQMDAQPGHPERRPCGPTTCQRPGASPGFVPSPRK